MNGHQTRFSDSSLYDEICTKCGATDAAGDDRLNYPCGARQYQKISEYTGGGVILNVHTTAENMKTWCPKNLHDEVSRFVRSGMTVVVHNKEIVAVGRAR